MPRQASPQPSVGRSQYAVFTFSSGGGLPVPSANLSYNEVTLAPSDLINLASTPVQVVGAPPTGQAWWIVAGYAAYHATSGAWSWGGGYTTHGPAIYWGTPNDGGTGSNTQAGIFPCDPFSGLQGGSDWVTTWTSTGHGFPESFNLTLPPNQPIKVGIGTGQVYPVNSIVTATVAAGGSGYAVNDTGTINGNYFGSFATYQVTTVSSGAVTAFTVTAAGTAYSTAQNPLATSATSGVGTGFTVNVTAVTAPVGTLKVGLLTSPVTLP